LCTNLQHTHAAVSQYRQYSIPSTYQLRNFILSQQNCASTRSSNTTGSHQPIQSRTHVRTYVHKRMRIQIQTQTCLVLNPNHPTGEFGHTSPRARSRWMSTEHNRWSSSVTLHGGVRLPDKIQLQGVSGCQINPVTTGTRLLDKVQSRWVSACSAASEVPLKISVQ